MFKLFKKSESGATLVEYGVAVILAITVGGGFLIVLADQTDDVMGCGESILTSREGAVVSSC